MFVNDEVIPDILDDWFVFVILNGFSFRNRHLMVRTLEMVSAAGMVSTLGMVSAAGMVSPSPTNGYHYYSRNNLSCRNT